jgi:hypothetical protein
VIAPIAAWLLVLTGRLIALPRLSARLVAGAEQIEDGRILRAVPDSRSPMHPTDIGDQEPRADAQQGAAPPHRTGSYSGCLIFR